MNDPKTEPAFPNASAINPNGDVMAWAYPGLTQYAEIAARFHAALIPQHGSSDGIYVANLALDQADAFFAELAKRTKS